MMLRLLLFVPLLPFVSPSFTAKDMLSAPRSSPAVPNPNGTLAVYTQSTYSFDTDSHTGGIFILPISTSKSESSSLSPKLLVNSTDAGGPVWLDNSTILYVVTKSGESTLCALNIEMGKESKVQSFDGAIGDLKALRVDDETVRIVFSAKVTPQGEIVRANESATPDVLVYDRLWVRHWDEWITPNKNALFSGTLRLSSGKHSHYFLHHDPKNMLNSTDDIHDLESPVPPFGGTEDFDLSTTHLAFVAKDPHLNPATNTASHVYIVLFNDSTYLEQVNSGPGASSSPVWSPDGKYLAYLEMRVPGYEADSTPASLPL